MVQFGRPLIRFAVEEQVLKGEDFYKVVPTRRIQCNPMVPGDSHSSSLPDPSTGGASNNSATSSPGGFLPWTLNPYKP